MENDIITPQYKKRKQHYLTLETRRTMLVVPLLSATCFIHSREDLMGILGAKTFTQKRYFGILFHGYIHMYSNITAKLHISPVNQQRQDCKLCSYKNSVHPNGDKSL